MSDSKTERQLNLFFILLNSNRPVTRQEIKDKILDYKNNDSEKAFERMFERDKDELRRNGILIKTINLNPLFEDEIGYLLDKETFVTKNIVINENEKLILKYALNIWSERIVNSNAENIFRKIGVANTDFTDLENFKLNLNSLSIQQSLLKSILMMNEIRIMYISAYQDEPHWRTIQPIQIYSQSKELFVKAIDVLDKDYKNYKLSNILELEIQDKKFSYSKELEKQTIDSKKVQIRIKKNAEYYSKLLKSNLISNDLIEISVFNYVASARYLLPYIHVIDEIFDEDLKKAVLEELTTIHEAVNG
ncbi:MAG: helix-turn-helix transcriptional regulator [Candidatus Nanopelagicales bacterium]